MAKRKGFTLIELTITISLLFIILLIVTPTRDIYTDYYKDRELQTVRRDFNTARTKAVTEGRIYTIHILEDGVGYIIRSNDGEILRTVNLEYIRFLSTSNERLHFTPRGSFLNPKTIVVEDFSKEKYNLKIGVATSKITLEKEWIWKKEGLLL